MAAVEFIWVTPPLAAWIPGYQQYIVNLFQMVEDILNARAEEIEVWMKTNHVWKNRTTLAEQKLFTKVLYSDLKFILLMGHGAEVYYSRFLERYMANARFSVLRPALDYWSPIVLEDLRRALK